MREQRLLERISDTQSNDSRTGLTRVQILVDSVIAHLKRVLNTRQGSVPIDPAFGVPDFTNLAGSFVSGETTQIMDDITRMVSYYEPRLKSPQLTIAENSNDILSLSFMLDGIITVDGHEMPVHLTTQVSSDGYVTLSMMG